MDILVTICARGGSKGIPGKNIRLINGKPLIALSIHIAKVFAKKYGADIGLSTEDEVIKQVAAQFGVKTSYCRPEKLATDHAGKLDAIIDLMHFEEELNQKKYEYVLDLDITSPLRNLQDLESAFDILKQDEKAINLFSVNTANRNPYFNMVEQQASGYYDLVKKGTFLTRQSAPPVYDLNASFYFYKRGFFDLPFATAINPWSLVYVMPHVCFDLDHLIDFEFMEYLIVNNKLGFEL